MKLKLFEMGAKKQLLPNLPSASYHTTADKELMQQKRCDNELVTMKGNFHFKTICQGHTTYSFTSKGMEKVHVE
jgi:hypothetical protein